MAGFDSDDEMEEVQKDKKEKQKSLSTKEMMLQLLQNQEIADKRQKQLSKSR